MHIFYVLYSDISEYYYVIILIYHFLNCFFHRYGILAETVKAFTNVIIILKM